MTERKVANSSNLGNYPKGNTEKLIILVKYVERFATPFILILKNKLIGLAKRDE